MEKLVYLLFAPAGTVDGDRLTAEASAALLDRLRADLPATGVATFSVDVTDNAADVPSPAPPPAGEAVMVAIVSAWMDCHDRRGPLEEALGALAAEHGWTVAGYLVLESLYTDYGDNQWERTRDWGPYERSPGLLTVALIHRPAGLDHDEWLRLWHGRQSPLSAEIQPRSRYVRNEVVRAVTDGAPEIGGIVEEAWPSASHVTDPMLFFLGEGDPDRMNTNIGLMMESVSACLDLDRLRSFTMSEHLA